MQEVATEFNRTDKSISMAWDFNITFSVTNRTKRKVSMIIKWPS